jgi:hypothetical protein
MCGMTVKETAMKKTVLGAVFVSAVAAGFFGAGTAAAAPGISLDRGTEGTKTIGIGDQTTTGATAYADEGSTALAVSFFKASQATTHGAGNTVVSINGSSQTGDSYSTDNRVFTVGGKADVWSTNDTVVTIGGTTHMFNTHDNTVFNLGGYTEGFNQDTDTRGVVSINVCGTQLTGQADHITVSSGSCQ